MTTETEQSVNDLLAEWDARRQPEISSRDEKGSETCASSGGSEPEQQTGSEGGDDEEQPELSEWEKTKQRVRELGIDESISAYESEIGELRSELEARDGAERLRVENDAWDKAVDSLIEGGANVDRDVLKNATLGEYLANEEFREAFDNRADDPQAWNDAIEAMADRLPRRDGGLIAAVKAAATERSPSSGGEYDGVDWGKLTDAELATIKQKVFADSAAGKLQHPYNRGWGKFA